MKRELVWWVERVEDQLLVLLIGLGYLMKLLMLAAVAIVFVQVHSFSLVWFFLFCFAIVFKNRSMGDLWEHLLVRKPLQNVFVYFRFEFVSSLVYNVVVCSHINRLFVFTISFHSIVFCHIHWTSGISV